MLIEMDQDLGLSLGLGSPETRRSIELNLTPSSSPPPMLFHSHHQWISDIGFQSGWRIAQTSQEIDVNRAPVSEIGNEDDASSPNSTVSTESSGAKRRYDASGVDEMDGERACLRAASDEEDGDGTRKKLRLSKEQGIVLEESFKENNTLNPKQKLALANKLNLRPRQVEVWFQNRRARTKLKQTEVDCELLKLCCENLKKENRRLQKEVQELKSLKLSPQFYMHMTPPTTLTMCPSCHRIAVSNPTVSPPPTDPSLPRFRQIHPPSPSLPAFVRRRS